MPLGYSTTYYWKIVAFNGSTCNVSGPIWNFQTEETPPCVGTPELTFPSDEAEGMSTCGITLTWDAAWNASSYNVYMGDAPDDLIYNTNVAGNSSGTYYFSRGTTYYWMVQAVNDACTQNSSIYSFTTSPWPCMIGAVTGWTWIFPYATVGGEMNDDPQPYNTNDRTSIMVVFEDGENIVPGEINASDFRVTYNYSSNGLPMTSFNETPSAAVVHQWEDDGIYYGSWDGTIVFLTVAHPMMTDDKPIVRLMDGVTEVQNYEADDGIAPIITLSISGDPSQGGDITVNATSTEDLHDAYIVAAGDSGRELPLTAYFPAEVQEPNYYGGYDNCDDNAFEAFGYTDDETFLQDMNWISDNEATWTFNMDPQDPQDTFFVEVYAHDETWAGCDNGGEWWLHEKWSSASETISNEDTIVLHLVEGWNLISFPRTPANPTLRGTFGDNVISKIYTFKDNAWNGSIYDPASGEWLTPQGLGTIDSLEGGIGYWVYCSNAGIDQSAFSDYVEAVASAYSVCDEFSAEISWTDLTVELVPPPDGPEILPTVPLSAGWNLVGVPIVGSLDQYRWGGSEAHNVPITRVDNFLSSVKDNWEALYWYIPKFTIRCYGDPYTFPSTYKLATPENSADWAEMAYWIAAFGSTSISAFPQQVPDWMVANTDVENYSGSTYEDSDYRAYNDSYTTNEDDIYFELTGITDAGEPIYLDFWGWADDGYAYGYDDGDAEVYNYATHDWENIDFSWWAYETGFDNNGADDENGFQMTGFLSGETEYGRTINGTFTINWNWDSYVEPQGENPYDFYSINSSELEGTITDTSYSVDKSILNSVAPVVLPGYGYWLWMDQADTLLPSVGTSTGSILPSGTPRY